MKAEEKMKKQDKIIENTIIVNRANFEYCAEHEIINGFLLQGIRDCMNIWESQQCFNEKEQNKRMRKWFSERTGLGDDILLSEHMKKIDKQ